MIVKVNWAKPARQTTWPARYSDDILRRPVAGHEPIIAVLLRDLESRRHKQQLELSREIDMAGEVGNEALGQRALVKSVVDQAHVGALQMRLVGGRGASQQSCVFPNAPARGIDVQVDERAWANTLGFGQRREVRHADIENEHAARAEQAKRVAHVRRRSSSVSKCDTEQHVMSTASKASPEPGQLRMSPFTSDTRRRTETQWHRAPSPPFRACRSMSPRRRSRSRAGRGPM